MLPLSGVMTPSSISSVVVLPAPFGPSSATRSPGATCEVDPGDGLSPPERLLQPQRSDDELHEGEVSPVQGAARVRLSNVLSQVAVGGWAGVK